jgi:hypothetical protein
MTAAVAALVWVLQQDPTTTAGGGASNVPQPVPDPSGIPGQTAIETILDIASWLGVAGAVLAIILGGGLFAFGHSAANPMMGSQGKNWVLGGLIGGLLVAMAGQLVSFMVGLQ